MIRQIASILIWIILIAVSARISFDIPLTDINITGQTLSILCMALLAKPRIAITAIVLYVVVGILGLPVFSEGNSGWSYFTDGGLGYFIGFIVAVITLSRLYWIRKEDDIPGNGIKILMLQLLGSGIILFFGVLRLAFQMPLIDAVLSGFTPFIFPAITKSLIGTLIIVIYEKLGKTFLSNNV